MKHKKKAWALDVRPLQRLPLLSSSSITSISFSFCYRFRKEIKKGHCFSNPPGMKAFTTLLHRAWPSCRLGSEWNHNRGMHSALSPIMWLVALNIVQKLISFHLMGFSTLESAKC